MSLFRRGTTLHSVGVMGRPGVRRGGPAVTTSSAMQQSVVWAAQRLRADLISLMPVDAFRPSGPGGVNIEVPRPPVLVHPSQIADGHPVAIAEWIYSGQTALDRAGNNFGVITAVDALGLPARIDLVNPDEVTARIRDGQIVEYRFNGEKHEPRQVWHERQFTVPGLPIGLSPIAHAALVLAGGIAAQEFAVDWFQNGAVPGGVLRNNKVTVDDEAAEIVKTRLLATLHNGEPLVIGNDWEYSAVAAKAAESSFIEQMGYSDQALCRFFGVPADLVDVHVDSATINYANITQRNLQLLVMNLGAAIKRREDALTRLMPGTRFVKLNREAILAMDPKTRAELFKIQIESRQRTPDETRMKDDLLPLSEKDYEQIERLWPPRPPYQPQTPGGS